MLSLTFLRNPGAAFGLGGQFTVLLTIISAIVIVVVAILLLRVRDRIWALGLALLFAGALGNLTDRLFREPGFARGYVVDFLDYGPFIGNVSDIYLTVAAVVIIGRSLTNTSLEGPRSTP